MKFQNFSEMLQQAENRTRTSLHHAFYINLHAKHSPMQPHTGLMKKQTSMAITIEHLMLGQIDLA